MYNTIQVAHPSFIFTWDGIGMRSENIFTEEEGTRFGLSFLRQLEHHHENKKSRAPGPSRLRENSGVTRKLYCIAHKTITKNLIFLEETIMKISSQLPITTDFVFFIIRCVA